MDRIKSAAILDNDGKIHTGKRHDLIFNNAQPFAALRGCKQGFVTEDGRFVDRVEGLYIATKANQIKHKHEPKNILFSEDYR